MSFFSWHVAKECVKSCDSNSYLGKTQNAAFFCRCISGFVYDKIASMEKQQELKQPPKGTGRPSSLDWVDKESPQERAAKRKERITLASLCMLLIVVLSILFTLLHQQFSSQASTSSDLPAVSVAETVPSPDEAAENSAQLPPVEAGLLVSFLDVGQGDSIFLRSPSGKTMLVDGGPESSFPVIDRYLTALGVVGLDVVVASHLHADHIGGLISVIDTYPVADFYDPPFDADSETYFRLRDALNESAAKLHSPLAGVNTMIPWDDAVEVRILSPYDTIYQDFNDTSYIIRVSYGNTAVLLTGDATELSEKLARKAQPDHYFRADVLKVAHHGSSDATFEAFLDAVSPAIAVISVGRDNDYGHPHDALLDRLHDRGITVYRTDEDGTITLLLDGTRVTVIE